MPPVELTAQRSSNLSKRLYVALCAADIRVPRQDESEPNFTRTALAPVVRAELNKLTGLPLQFRGDGGDSQAVPASALEIPFYPDLAVSTGKQHLWAAEVKVLRKTNRQNAIATALGQATLYRSRYEHVLVVLIDTSPTNRQSQRQLADSAKDMGLRVVIRPRVGNVLLPQAAR
jgi:hypothetical protein